MDPLKIIFAGSGEFGLPTLRALAGAGHQLVCVVTQPDRPAGRGRGVTPTSIGKFAAVQGMALLRTERIDKEILPAADLMVVIAFGQKIGPATVNHPRMGSINLHASRLPRHRGAAPINWAILSGDLFTGNSVIRLAERMDAGAVLGQSSVQIGQLETAGELHDRLAQDGVPLVMKTVEQLATGTATECLQNESLATAAPKLSRESGRLDFNRPSEALARQIRGLYPWPGCRVRVVDKGGIEVGRFRPVRARGTDQTDVDETPGTIGVSGSVVTGEGALELVECQPDGGRPMSFGDYRRGHPWSAGMRLEAAD